MMRLHGYKLEVEEKKHMGKYQEILKKIGIIVLTTTLALNLINSVPVYAEKQNETEDVAEAENKEKSTQSEASLGFPFEAGFGYRMTEEHLKSMWVGDKMSIKYTYRKEGYICEAIESAENVEIIEDVGGSIRFLKEGTVKLKVYKKGEPDSEQVYNVNVLPAKEPYVEQLLPERIKIGNSFDHLYRYYNSPIETENGHGCDADFQVSQLTWDEHGKYFLQGINWGGADLADPDTRILEGYLPGCATKPGVFKVAATRDEQNPYLVTIEEPVIKSNLPQTIKTGTELKVTTSLENTSLNNRKIEEVIKDIQWDGGEPPENRYPIGYQPKIEIVSGAELVKRSNGDYTNILNTSETMKFMEEGTVKFKVTYDMHTLYKNNFIKIPNFIDYTAPHLPVAIYEEAMYSPEATFTVTVKDEVKGPAAVTNLKSVPAGKQQVRLTWSESEGAEGYLIYAQKNGKYGYVGMTTSGMVFKDAKALDGDYNYYWVFPYITDENTGKMIPGECPQYVYAKGILPSVKNLKGISTKSGAKLTWNKLAGADGYLIYGRVNGKNYGYVGATTGTTFIDKKAGENTFSFYWVFPYHMDKNDKIIPGNISTKYVYGKKL